MKSLFTTLIVAGGLCWASSIQAQCKEPSVTELASFFLSHSQPPEDYVLSKFKDHDVVILGEFHKIKHDLNLIHRLIPMAYATGVNVLATEFARAEDQPLIDSLLTGKVYDEKLARRIAFEQFVSWGFREYVDVFRVAWELNQSLPDGAARFRIIGINCSPDYSIYQNPGDQQVDSLRFRARQGCEESKWALIVRRVLENHPKMLVHCGVHHAFTRFLQPIISSDGTFIRFEDDRFGRHLYNWLGDRLYMIVLHYPWQEGTYGGAYRRPASGLIDSAAALLAAEFQPFGVDVVGTPLECITDSTTVYAKGHRPFRLGDFCDGYVMQKRFADYETVGVIVDFVNSENLHQAQQQHPNPWYRKQPSEAFRTGMERDLEYLRQLLQPLK